MKTLILITLSFLALNVYSQGKFESEIDHNLKLVKVKKVKQPRTKKFRKENLGSGNKLKLSLGYGFGVYNTKISEVANLTINESSVYFGDKKVGTSQFAYQDNRYQNTITLDNKQINWYSNEMATNYEFVSEANTNRKTLGFNLELRAYKYDGLGSPTGFFINTGVYYLDKSMPLLDYNAYEVLFPIGIGVIIPGNNRFRVELGGNGVIGHTGCLGGKFDFSFVIDDIKFGPSFLYLSNNQDLSFKAGGLGFGISYVPIKTKKWKRRRF